MPDDRRRVRLHAIGVHRCEACWRLGPERTRAWNDLDLWLLLGGEGRVDTPEGRHQLAPGSCLVLRGGEDYDFRQHPRRRFHHWFAHFSFLDPAGAPLPPAADPPPRHRRLDGHQMLVGLLERAQAAHLAGDPAADRWLEAALWELERCDAALARPADPWRQALDALVARLRADPAAAPSVAGMARALGLGGDRFARVFRARTGLAPRAFVVQARLERARLLLAESTLAVGGIAASCGFADPAFFCRHFAAHHGCSPGAWRQAARRR